MISLLRIFLNSGLTGFPTKKSGPDPIEHAECGGKAIYRLHVIPKNMHQSIHSCGTYETLHDCLESKQKTATFRTLLKALLKQLMILDECIQNCLGSMVMLVNKGLI
jgi:hypothetical protein